MIKGILLEDLGQVPAHNRTISDDASSLSLWPKVIEKQVKTKMFEIFDAKVYSEPFSGKKSIVLHNYQGMESPPIGLLDIKSNSGLQ
jgi:hypothetical protein